MRSSLILAAAILGCAGPAPAGDAGPRFVSLGADALEAARSVAARRGAPLQIFEASGGAAVVAIDGRDLGRLAEQIHRRNDRCGGFMVHDSLAEAHAALAQAGAALAQAGDDPGALRPGLDYTLDRAAAVRAVLPALDSARIRDTIRELSAMPNRYYQSPSGAQASIWLRDRWRSLTSRPDVTVELFDHGYAQKSVILTIPGTTRPDEVVVIGGHLDSIAAGGVSSTAPGADDDASGIATVTEVLRVLLASDYRPARTLRFMAYAAEEVGLRGSLGIARDYQRRGVGVVGALQLDMTNYRGSDRDIWLMRDFTSAAQNSFLGRLIDTYVGATWGLDACGYACSDHAAWHRTGVPASMPFESRMRDRNRQIHTRRDTLETSDASAEHAVKFARLAAAYAIELGKGELGEGELGEGTLASRTSPAGITAAPAQARPAAAAGSPGHLGAAAALALLVLCLWAGHAAVSRAG
jgi:leucyl aminopeptidase